MLDNEFKIAKVEPFKLNNIIKIKSFIITKDILRKDIDDKEFKETVLIDEFLEAEDE